MVFMTGVALPLIVAEFDLSTTQKGAVGAATLAGILVGASALGALSDTFGRKRMFIIEMALFAFFLAGLTFAPSYIWVVLLLFGVGLALGCDYPTAHLIISESTPSRARGKLVLSAFAFQAVGALVGTGTGYLILSNVPDIAAWRWMSATAIIPAMLVTTGRFFITDSGHWLMSRGRHNEAERALTRLLERYPAYPKAVHLAELSPANANHHGGGYGQLFDKTNRRATILASIPWFIQDLGTYGIGIFTPTILLLTLGHDTGSAHNIASLVSHDITAAKGAAMLDVLLILGIIGAVLLADRVGRIRLQFIGFLGCALGLTLAAVSSHVATLHIPLLFAGFMLFNFMTNLGPNAQTYLLAGEVFPTGIRGKGAGFAASFAKIGAVITAFFFPVFLKDFGVDILLAILVGTSLLGALTTWLFRIETARVSLEDI